MRLFTFTGKKGLEKEAETQGVIASSWFRLRGNLTLLKSEIATSLGRIPPAL